MIDFTGNAGVRLIFGRMDCSESTRAELWYTGLFAEIAALEHHPVIPVVTANLERETINVSFDDPTNIGVHIVNDPSAVEFTVHEAVALANTILWAVQQVQENS
jgi:hypothetical protein